MKQVSREEKLEEALQDVMTWIRNWDPNFIYDEEWRTTAEKVTAALKKD